MIETHPLLPFVPPKTKYLLLGSFVTKEAFDNKKRANYTWYYANGGRNQFWPMLQDIYDVDLQTRKSMQNLMAKLHMAVADIIYRCERKKKRLTYTKKFFPNSNKIKWTTKCFLES